MRACVRACMQAHSIRALVRMYGSASATVCTGVCMRVCACAPAKHHRHHGTAAPQRYHSSTAARQRGSTAARQHGSTAARRKSSTAPPYHHSSTAQQRDGPMAPQQEKHDRRLVVFLAPRWSRCSTGEAHATSANSTSLVEFAIPAGPPPPGQGRQCHVRAGLSATTGRLGRD